MNDCWRLAPWADLLYGCDLRWWAQKRPSDAQFAGLRVTQDEVAAARYGAIRVASADLPGLGRAPWLINQGGNSGYQAVNLAWHMGARKMVLVGFDMGYSDAGRTHWFGDHPPELQVPSPFQDWLKKFGVLAHDLQQESVDVVNCTAKTALTCFRKGSLKDEL